MDYLQYQSTRFGNDTQGRGFKPYYKWITFNIIRGLKDMIFFGLVLNLIINGLPSIYLEHHRQIRILMF